MALKFRRTLSMEDLTNASDEEMDNLLSASSVGEYASECTSQQYKSNQKSVKAKNGMRVGPIIAPGIDSPENDDFFLHGPQAPILNLDNTDITLDLDQTNQNTSSTNIPRSKSVRFEDLDENDRLKRVKGQVYEVTEKMRDNVARLLDREASLDSLADLSDQMQYSSDIYRQSSEHLRRKMWWRQQRTRMVLGAVFVIGIFLLLIPIFTKLLQ